MKNSFTKIGILAVVIMFTLTSCDKDDTEPIEPVQDKEMFAMGIEVRSDTGLMEKGILVGTEPELKKAIQGNEGEIYLTKESQANNIYIPNPDVGVSGDDTTDDCWNEITSYYNNNYNIWLQKANEYCKDVSICLTCPEAGGGLYVLYVIEPNSINCITDEELDFSLAYALKPFPYDPGDYESEEVSMYIKRM